MIDLHANDPSANLSTLLSIGRFSRLPETRGMVEWLKVELARLDTLNRKETDDAILRQRQGACQVLEAILKIADEADSKAEQIRAIIMSKSSKGVKL